ncbi:MAG: hypothetical protein CYPHOPRED_000542 [Cyphobasidiales sp. Tagirdzhanova-0007]|nr:MAG: hypothetical protein CYPHOPRED_000542 [Cyphobasidiales sp. Tagirdzhanova-0007]
MLFQLQEATKTQKLFDGSFSSPNDLLPLLQLPDGRIVKGSLPCIEYLEEAYPTQPSLWSKDLVDRSRERVWLDWIRRTCIPAFMRVLRSREEGKQEASSLDLCKILNMFAEEVRGPYFSGDQPTLPDIVIAPFILRVRMRISNRIWGPARHADAGAKQRYQRYAENLLALESLKRTSPDAEEPIVLPCTPVRRMSTVAPKLPPEIISHILSFSNDYELACTLKFPHAMAQTSPWVEQSTPLDRAILSSHISTVRSVYRSGHRRFSKWGARVLIRFGYVHILDWLFRIELEQMHLQCDELLPEVASAWGRVEVLEWAYRSSSFGIPANIPPRAMDDASRNGHVKVLQWWLNSGIHPLSYSEDALNHATIKKHIDTLEWWKSSGLPLKVGNVLDFASMVKDDSTDLLEWWNSKSGLKATYTKMALYHLSSTGNIKLLQWWKDSRLPLVYDKEVLVGATKQGKIESLEWWLRSELPVSYTFFDIEEAIEDSVAGREAVELWWCKHGLRSYANAQNWTKSRALGK